MAEHSEEAYKYIERLRRITIYQRYVINPFLFVLFLLECYQAYYYQDIWRFLVLPFFIVGIVYHHYDSARTFAKIMRWKLS